MPTTTNYGWTTPADTDLVKDGASAIRTLGTAIDTTVFNNASAAIAKTIVDAKGDLIAATAADTVSRIAVGSNDQVLTADSSTATGLKWATPATGSLTLISTTTLSGSSTTINISANSYKHMQVWIEKVSTTNDVDFFMRINGDTGNNYSWAYNGRQGTSGYATGGAALVSSIRSNFAGFGANTSTNWTVMDLFNVNSTGYKNVFYVGAAEHSPHLDTYMGTGAYISSSAITSLTFFIASGTYNSGTINLYGVN